MTTTQTENVMTIHYRIVRDTYHDSVQLMRIANDVAGMNGVTHAEAVMGTPSNRETVVDSGRLTSADLTDVGTDDLILVAEATDEATAADAVDEMAEKLTAHTDDPSHEQGAIAPKSIRQATADAENPRLALISVPGEYAAREAWKALRDGLDVCLFSDNVSLEDERKLKVAARERDCLVMGPDCGTAIVDGHPLGFANDVTEGSVGVISASGTGLQAVTSRVSRRGGGISQAIGTGGRDLSADVGGITTCSALVELDADPETEVIVLLSKPPSDTAVDAVSRTVAECSTPVIAHFQGYTRDHEEMHTTASLATTADAALEAAGIDPPPAESRLDEQAFESAVSELDGEQTYVRGLFTGGTLCTEAALILSETIDPVRSNVGIGDPVADPRSPDGHAVIDIGTDALTTNRPHPMIDPTLRNECLERALEDPTVGVLLCDVVLGYGAHEDPAGEVATVVAEADTETVVVASVCGTDGDPQHRSSQIASLESAGIYVAESNAAAARLATAAGGVLASEPEEGSE